MRIRRSLAFLALCIFPLTACSGQGGHTFDDALLLPPPEIQDPGDQAVRKAVAGFLIASKAPAASQYDFDRIDLDGDGRRDALVLFRNPYGYWCDMHGCTMLVLKAGDDNFTFVNATQPIREPLFVSPHSTNGWRDLIVRVSGRWDKAKDVALTYDGTQYPGIPSALPPYMRVATNEDLRLFYNEGT